MLRYSNFRLENGPLSVVRLVEPHSGVVAAIAKTEAPEPEKRTFVERMHDDLIGFLLRFMSVERFEPVGLWGVAGPSFTHGGNLQAGLHYQFHPNGLGLEMNYGSIPVPTRRTEASNLPEIGKRETAFIYRARVIKATAALQRSFGSATVGRRIRTPMAIRAGLGGAWTHIEETAISYPYRLASGATSPVGYSTSTFSRLDPMFNLQLGYYVRNFMELALTFDYVFSRPAPIKYGGGSVAFQAGYRLF